MPSSDGDIQSKAIEMTYSLRDLSSKIIGYVRGMCSRRAESHMPDGAKLRTFKLAPRQSCYRAPLTFTQLIIFSVVFGAALTDQMGRSSVHFPTRVTFLRSPTTLMTRVMESKRGKRCRCELDNPETHLFRLVLVAGAHTLQEHYRAGGYTDRHRDLLRNRRIPIAQGDHWG
jgi:hypothetical protein